jgi:hypothetical protein
MALTSDQERELLSAAEPRKAAWGWLKGKKADPDDTDRAVVHAIQKLDEQLAGEARCDLDLAWDAIHRSFDGGSLTFNLDEPAKGFVMGGRQLHRGDDWIISFKSSEQVRAIADAADSITDDEVGLRYDALDPNDYEVDKTEEDRAYTVEYFVALRGFYQRAAKNGQAIVFSADQ